MKKEEQARLKNQTAKDREWPPSRRTFVTLFHKVYKLIVIIN